MSEKTHDTTITFRLPSAAAQNLKQAAAAQNLNLSQYVRSLAQPQTAQTK